MYNITIVKPDSLNSVEKLSSINLSDDVIISQPEESSDLVSFNIDGKILIHPDKDINFTFAKQLTGYVPCLREQIVRMPIKLYIPYGYEPIFVKPVGVNWISDITVDYESYSGYILDDDYELVDKSVNIFSKSPNYIIYRRFVLKFIINTELMKSAIPTMTIGNSNTLCELHINKNLCNHFASGKIFYIQNNEVYYKLADTI